MKARKAAIIGVGHVGAHAAFALTTQGIVDEIVLIDKDPKKTRSEVQDLNDALLMLPYSVKITEGTYEDLKDTDLIVYSVGDIELLRADHDRIHELSFNTKQLKETAAKIKNSGFDGILINISNPCDVITALLDEMLGLPKGHVFGTGTALDTSRLLSVLSKKTGIDERSITAYMLGEHGNEQFAPRSILSFKGAPLSSIESTAGPFDWTAIEKDAIAGGWITFSGKYCTEYGIAATGARLARAVLRNEHLIMPVSAPLTGQYGQSGLFAGVPAVIGSGGIEQVIELPLTETERERFDACAQTIRNNLQTARELLNK